MPVRFTGLSETILDAVGDTPLLNVEGIYAKLEFLNPSGSIKARIANYMIERAEHEGLLKPGDTIVEATSGNTGIALAMVGAARGYKVVLTMPETMSMERRQLLRAYGAEVVLTPGSGGIRASVEKAEELAAALPGAMLARQFENAANPAIHFATTGPEIWADTDGAVDIFVAGVGTGGTVSGTGDYLKQQKPSVQVVAVEPLESPLLNGGVAGPHKIQGIGANFIPAILDREIYDEVIDVDIAQSVAMARRLGVEEGILGGISSGASVEAAVQLAKRPENAGKTIVVIIASFGERYLSTVLYEDLVG